MQSTIKWKIAQFAEIRWWKNYLKHQTVADYLRYKRQYWHDFLHKIDPHFSLPAQARVLDAGCGPAGIFIVFDRQQVTAVDPLLGHYERELPHFSPAQYPYAHFVESPLEAFMPDAPFAHVFCLNAINHVSDLAGALDRLAACVAPGGTLYLSIDAHNHDWLKWIFRALPFDILHPHQYSLREYAGMLEERGMKIAQEIRYSKHPIFDYYLLVARKA
jgi:2-polyprenyl-6-hydroxyphenyl methylase/3-demethylubiquinone-9 3-methyltransferase